MRGCVEAAEEVLNTDAAAAPRITNWAGSRGAGGGWYTPGRNEDTVDATGISGVLDGRMMPALGEPVLRRRGSSGVVCCDPGKVPTWAVPGGWLAGGIAGAEVVMICVLDVDWDKDSCPSDRGGGVGLTKMPSEPRTQPAGGCSSGGK